MFREESQNLDFGLVLNPERGSFRKKSPYPIHRHHFDAATDLSKAWPCACFVLVPLFDRSPLFPPPPQKKKKKKKKTIHLDYYAFCLFINNTKSHASEYFQNIPKCTARELMASHFDDWMDLETNLSNLPPPPPPHS